MAGCTGSKSPGQQQDHDDDKDDPDAANRAIAPGSVVLPSRKSADEGKDQKDEKYGSKAHLKLLLKEWLRGREVGLPRSLTACRSDARHGELKTGEVLRGGGRPDGSDKPIVCLFNLHVFCRNCQPRKLP